MENNPVRLYIEFIRLFLFLCALCACSLLRLSSVLPFASLPTGVSSPRRRAPLPAKRATLYMQIQTEFCLVPFLLLFQRCSKCERRSSRWNVGRSAVIERTSERASDRERVTTRPVPLLSRALRRCRCRLAVPPSMSIASLLDRLDRH